MQVPYGQGEPFDFAQARLQTHSKRYIQQIERESYQVSPIRGVEIPKSNGKKRLLGIPTVVAWSHTRIGGWAVDQRPILPTTIKVKRLKMKGYLGLIEYYKR